MREMLLMFKRKRQRAKVLRSEIADLNREIRIRTDELDAIEGQLHAVINILKEETVERKRKPKSRHGFTGGSRAKPIQEGSSVWWTAKVLSQMGRPAHISNILDRIQRESGLEFRKTTLVSNLSRYVRFGDTFNRPGPNIFGLIDFSTDPVATDRQRFEEEQEDE